MDISGKGLVFDTTGNDTVRYQVLEGYKAFRLKSTQDDANNVLKMVLKDSSGNTIDTQVSPLRTIKNIGLKIQRITAEPKVGGQKYEYALTFIDEDKNVL